MYNVVSEHRGSMLGGFPDISYFRSCLADVRSFIAAFQDSKVESKPRMIEVLAKISEPLMEMSMSVVYLAM